MTKKGGVQQRSNILQSAHCYSLVGSVTLLYQSLLVKERELMMISVPAGTRTASQTAALVGSETEPLISGVQAESAVDTL